MASLGVLLGIFANCSSDRRDAPTGDRDLANPTAKPSPVGQGAHRLQNTSLEAEDAADDDGGVH